MDTKTGSAPFDRTLETMLTAGGKGTSDLMFVVGQPPQVEINGVLTPVEIAGLHPVLRPEHTEGFKVRKVTYSACEPNADPL